MTEPAGGVLRLYRDVMVQRSGDEWIVMSRQPAVAGEMLVLDVVDLDEGYQRDRFSVCVIESRPVIVDGEMWHRIRLDDGRHLPLL